MEVGEGEGGAGGENGGVGGGAERRRGEEGRENTAERIRA